MICIECGKPIDDDSKFCRYCGKEVNHAPSVEPAPQPKEVKGVGKDMEELLKDSRLIGYTFKNWWLIHISAIIAIGQWTIIFLIGIVSWVSPHIPWSGHLLPPTNLIRILIYGSFLVGIYGYCLPALTKLYQIRRVGFYDEGGVFGNGKGWGIFFGLGSILFLYILIELQLSMKDFTGTVILATVILLPFASASYFSFRAGQILKAPENHLLERREIELN